MNAKVVIEDGKATVSFAEGRATSLSTKDINALKAELRAEGVDSVTVNSGKIVELTGRCNKSWKQNQLLPGLGLASMFGQLAMRKMHSY